MAEFDYSPRELSWRFKALEKDLDQLQSNQGGFVDKESFMELKNDVKIELSSIRRALYTTALSVAGSAVLFALTVFALVKP